MVMYSVSLLGKHNMEWVGNGLDSAGNKSTQTYLWVDNFYIDLTAFWHFSINYYYFTTYLYII